MKRGRRQKKHEFQGEEIGKTLVEWLQAPRSATRERITEIIETYDEIIAIEERQRVRHGWSAETGYGMPGVRFLHAESEAISKLRATLTSQLRRYRGQLALGTQGRTRLAFVVTAKINDEERDKISAVLALASQDLLRRVRRCQRCGSWFYARFAHARSCGVKCRVAYSQSKPEWKKRRNAQRRKNYQQKKKKGGSR